MDLQQQPINEKANTSPPVTDINEIGWIFVQEYYTFLHKQPNRLHCFYGKNSHFNHGVEGEIVKTLIGDKEIKEKIKSLNFEKCRVAVTSVDCQASKDNGIIIQVLGMMSNHDEPSRKFAQTFFLATQPNGYFVLNDIIRFLLDDDDNNDDDGDESDDVHDHDNDICTEVKSPDLQNATKNDSSSTSHNGTLVKQTNNESESINQSNVLEPVPCAHHENDQSSAGGSAAQIITNTQTIAKTQTSPVPSNVQKSTSSSTPPQSSTQLQSSTTPQSPPPPSKSPPPPPKSPPPPPPKSPQPQPPPPSNKNQYTSVVNDKPVPIQQSTSLQNHHVVANTPIQSTTNSQSTQTKLPLVNVNKSPKLLPQDISQTISKVDDEQSTTTDTINEPESALENEITTNGVDKAQKTNNEQVENTIQEPVKKVASIVTTKPNNNDNDTNNNNNNIQSLNKSTPPVKTWANLAANNADKWNNEALLDPKGHATTVTTPIAKNQRNSSQQQKRDNHDSHDRSQDGQRIGVRRVSETGFSIYVKGVKPGMTYDLLKGKFSKFGNVKHLDVVPTRNCAFVEYSSSEAYQYALNAKSIEVNSVTLYIEERRPPRRNNYNNKGAQQHNRNY